MSAAFVSAAGANGKHSQKSYFTTHMIFYYLLLMIYYIHH
jgi:hypothetical protein